MVETIAGERLEALLSQESHYSCPNYLSSDYLSSSASKDQICPPSTPTLLHIVEECANLVTDLSLVGKNDKSPSLLLVKSPSSVSSFAAFVSSATEHSSATPDMEHCHLSTWRKQMCSWAYRAVDTFELDRELVAIAFDLLDRYLANECMKADSPAITREDFQLFSMTCLYTTIKILEPKRKLSIQALIDMSRGYYCADDITETELDILEAVQWRVCPPTALAFCQELLSCVDVATDVVEFCRQLTEQAVADDFCVSHKASTVGVAVILVAARRYSYPTDAIMTLIDSSCCKIDMNKVQSVYMHLGQI